MLAGLAASIAVAGSQPSAAAESARPFERPDLPQHQWQAGTFLFSDELGGFTINAVRGSGSRSDPVVITQSIHSVGPSVLTVRMVDTTRAMFDLGSTWKTLYLQLETLNSSPAGWIGYGLELQKVRGEPSIYGDGLSFNQLNRDESAIVSDRFARYEVEYEPGDRLVFTGGWVDPRMAARFRLFLLDLSPNGVFYIEQQPQLPAF